MGFFDFFRRKPREPEPSPEVQELASALESMDRPRCHHYTLAHYALRGMALSNPLAYLGIMASPNARDFLADLLKQVSEDCAASERLDFSVDNLKVHKVRIGPYPCAMVELPPPRGVTEAYFTAAVLLADLDSVTSEEQELPLRYFTLEKGANLGDGSRTVLCEWNEQSHLNYGDGPEPDVQAFARAIEKMVLK
ncbi:MAG: hypothetical protein AB7K24_15725 [Gemmataceae bacterium]